MTQLAIAKPEAIFIDLDGTLVDSAPDLSAAITKTFNQQNLVPPSPEKIASWIGNGVDKLLHRSLTNSMDGIAENDKFWASKRIFTDAYNELSGQFSSVYASVVESLSHWKNSKIKLVCITNKDRQFTIPLLERHQLIGFFDAVVCGDDLSDKKPSPAPLIYAKKQLGIQSDSILMIGDSKSDVLAANAAKIPVACVNYGYSQGVDLKQFDIKGFIDQFSSLIFTPKNDSSQNIQPEGKAHV